MKRKGNVDSKVQSLALHFTLKLGGILLLVLLVVFSMVLTLMFRAEFRGQKETYSQENSLLSEKIREPFFSYKQVYSQLALVAEKLLEEPKLGNRGKIVEEMMRAFVANEKIDGLGVVFDANVLDDNDSFYVNSQGSDESGRFMPYIYRSEESGKIELITLERPEGNAWYEKTYQSGEHTLIGPYEDIDGTLLVSVSYPIKKNEKTVGVVLVDVPLGIFQDIVGKYSDDKDFKMVLSYDGMIVAQGRDKNRALAKYEDKGEADYLSKIKKGESFITSGMSNTTGKSVYKIYTSFSIPDFPKTPWSVVSVVDRSIMNEASFGAVKLAIFTMIIGLVTVVVFVWLYINRGVVRPILFLKKIIDKNSDLNFKEVEITKEIEEVLKRKDEIGQMANSLRKMDIEIRNLLCRSKEMSQSLTSSSDDMRTSAATTAKVSSDISGAINEIAKGTTEQAKNTEDGAGAMKKVALSIDRNDELMNELGESLKSVLNLKDEGLVAVSSLIKSSEGTQKSASALKDMIDGTKESADRINEKSQMIQSISEQTNLLALNAAIEAARAGEAGKGFAVVAEEIRNLAENSSKFAGEIKLVVEELILSVQSAVETMSEMEATVDKQGEFVNFTENKFVGISKAIDVMTDGISEMDAVLNLVRDEKENMQRVIENLSALSEENAAASEEISASVEVQSFYTQDLSSEASNVSDLARELLDLISKFEL